MFYQPCVRFDLRFALKAIAVACAITSSVNRNNAAGQTLVANPFNSGYTGWVDPFAPPARLGNWRLSLNNPTLMETNNANPPTSGGGTNTGLYQPNVLVQNNFQAPANYELSATMRTSDDDLLGLVWNYQDANNYFRVGIRQQPGSGTFGATQGISVQKVVDGVVTQLLPSTPMIGAEPITQEMINSRTPFDLKVAVSGSNYEVFFNNVSYGGGTDASLAAGRKVGFQSWAQLSDDAAVTPAWGTEIEQVSVKQGASTLYNQSFAARPTAWRPMVMTNAAGVSSTTSTNKEMVGNFGVSVNNPWIFQNSNANVNATFGNVDFIGPGVVVNEPGSANFTNYQMQVRMGTTDNDGMGVIVRAQDDNNFYRITFANEATDAALTTRAPRGMSVQKVRNGVWTELYRDDSNPLFVYTPGATNATPNTGLQMFDLSVGAVGNSLKIQVRDHAGAVYNYPLITDSSDPILSGSVGFQTWGQGDPNTGGGGAYYMGYGGQAGPLVTTLSAFSAFDATINRATGNLILVNNSGAPVQIRGVSVNSAEGGLNAANWLSVTNNYDEAPQSGSVDPNDPWTITSSTSLSISEREQSSGGDGAMLANGQSINLGNVWRKSRIEDLNVSIELFNGSVTNAGVAYAGVGYHRADLNTDGAVNANDWNVFHPNLLADLSSLTGVQVALAGDLDGDGDNDVDDFSLFKADFDQLNGVGAFQAMLASVPEPSTLSLLFGGLAALAVRTGRRSKRVALGTVALTVVGADATLAAPVDLTTYTTETFAPTATFGAPIWATTPSSASLNSNADATVLLSPASALSKRFIGRVTPGTDDDVIGFVMGFDPGDGFPGSTADYLLLDWKGATQAFDFADGSLQFFHHDLTLTGTMPVGLALSRVTGSPTADEMWQHLDLPENSTGGVAELARGATLGSSAYNRTNGSHLVDITYTSTRVTVKVDGVQQFDVAGSFPDGRFGLYSAWQGPTATFSDFEVFSAGFAGLSATVDRTTGNVTLRNTGSEAVSFDFYQLESASGSLKPTGWNSLSDQNFQSIGAGAGQSWDEAGGSDSGALAEAFLQTTSTLNANASISLGSAYNNIINGEDLTLSFRLPSGMVLPGLVNYIGEAPGGQPGDYDGDSDVDGGDFLVWQRAYGAVGNNPADGNNDNVVNGDDLTVWKNNYGTSGAVGAAAAVPEPATAALLAGGLAALALRRRSI